MPAASAFDNTHFLVSVANVAAPLAKSSLSSAGAVYDYRYDTGPSLGCSHLAGHLHCLTDHSQSVLPLSPMSQDPEQRGVALTLASLISPAASTSRETTSQTNTATVPYYAGSYSDGSEETAHPNPPAPFSSSVLEPPFTLRTEPRQATREAADIAPFLHTAYSTPGYDHNANSMPFYQRDVAVYNMTVPDSFPSRSSISSTASHLFSPSVGTSTRSYGEGRETASSSESPPPATDASKDHFYSNTSTLRPSAGYPPEQSTDVQSAGLWPAAFVNQSRTYGVVDDAVHNSMPDAQAVAHQGVLPVSAPEVSVPSTLMAPAQIGVSQLATYLAEMVVYLWFSPPKHTRRSASVNFPKPSSSFTRFCNDVLVTTQVSQSVVVLALYFVWKLQAKHGIVPDAGSEYKLTITGLMLANKILDDHTYTNRTWSDVSGLPLASLTAGEMEFLAGLNFNLHVSQTMYNSWLAFLERPEPRRANKGTPLRKKARFDIPQASITPSAPTSPARDVSALQTGEYFFPAPQCPAFPRVAAPVPAFSETVDGSRKRRASGTQQTLGAPGPSQFSQPHTYVPSGRPTSSSGAVLLAPNVTRPQYEAAAGPTFAFATDSGVRTAAAQSSGFDQSGAEFPSLTSYYAPVDGQARQNLPESLAYYELAAGQPGGGHLTYQPVAVRNVIPANMTHAAVIPYDMRQYAPLPCRLQASHASVYDLENTALHPPQHLAPGMRVALSHSPVDQRTVRQAPRQIQPVPMHRLSAHSSTLPSTSAARLQYTPPPQMHLTVPQYQSGVAPQTAPSGRTDTYSGGTFDQPGRQIYFPRSANSSPTDIRSGLYSTQYSMVMPSSYYGYQPADGTLLPAYSAFSNSGVPGVPGWYGAAAILPQIAQLGMAPMPSNLPQNVSYRQ